MVSTKSIASSSLLSATFHVEVNAKSVFYGNCYWRYRILLLLSSLLDTALYQSWKLNGLLWCDVACTLHADGRNQVQLQNNLHISLPFRIRRWLWRWCRCRSSAGYRCFCSSRLLVWTRAALDFIIRFWGLWGDFCCVGTVCGSFGWLNGKDKFMV